MIELPPYIDNVDMLEAWFWRDAVSEPFKMYAYTVNPPDIMELILPRLAPSSRRKVMGWVETELRGEVVPDTGHPKPVSKYGEEAESCDEHVSFWEQY